MRKTDLGQLNDLLTMPDLKLSRGRGVGQTHQRTPLMPRRQFVQTHELSHNFYATLMRHARVAR
jgi:hypothetical protein